MKLNRFKVENFRSISDSGWIENDNVTSLVGVNEAGKSNLLLALWKMNPATGGEINPLEDIPRSKYSEWRNLKRQKTFITCEFELTDPEIIQELITLTGCNEEDVRITKVSRDFNGIRTIGFPNYSSVDFFDSAHIKEMLNSYKLEFDGLEEKGKSEAGLKDTVSAAYSEAEGILLKTESIEEEGLQDIYSIFDLSIKELQKSEIQPHLKRLREEFTNLIEEIKRPGPSSFQEARKLILKHMPKFVYYSNYGNLDSEIYLPHVIENMQRDDLSSAMQAKVRTLKVLFEFVNLDPDEILELGAEIKLDQYQKERPLTDEEISSIAEKKAERDILLQSAGLRLTEEFKLWWKQGDYKFRFQADGRHFKIWVSDEKRPEEISLEGRSTGLQWFLSFYLIFLVESKDTHENAILLLDEAGVSLHPLAQKDLASFFENLSVRNQLIYTTHSPFLVDTNSVDRVKVVYLDEGGKTVASNDLRAVEAQTNKNNSVYAVHAALGLSISDVLLQGCKIVIVEGPSDQYYLNAIKTYLIRKELFHPKEEIIFIPSGGVKGIRALSSLLSGKDETLPVVLLDSDKSGKGQKTSLLKDLYKDFPSRIVEIDEIVQLEQAEVEDLIPIALIERHVSKLSRGIDEEFIDLYDETKALLPQVERYFIENDIRLEKGWKVDLARSIKRDILNPKKARHIGEEIEGFWTKLFKSLES